MEIPKYWRLQTKFKQFTGYERVNGKGPEYSFNGRHWAQPSNRHHETRTLPVHQSEGPPGNIVYQAEKNTLEIAPAD